MPRNISIPARNAIQAQSAADGFLVLLTAISSPTTVAPIRIVNNNEDIISRGMTYVGWPFELSLPGDEDERVAQANVTFDNVDARIMDTLRQVSGDMYVALEVILMSDPNNVIMATTGLKMRRIVANDKSITADLMVDNVYHMAYPADDYTPVNTPGIFR